MAENPYQFMPPGGQFNDLVGANLNSVVNTVEKMVHHFVTTAEITTLNFPSGHEGFVGPVYLVADSLFKWTSSGNIAAPPGTTLIANHAYGFIYDRKKSKWYPLGLPAVAS